jgi:hypothetical protein
MSKKVNVGQGRGRLLFDLSCRGAAFFKFTLVREEAGSFAFRPNHGIFDAQTDPSLFNRATKE